VAPVGRPAYLFFRHYLSRAYRFLDLRAHAPVLPVAAAAYAGGTRDRGVRPEDTRGLARLAGAECLLVDGAGHLEAIKLATDEILELALATFRRAERALAATPRGPSQPPAGRARRPNVPSRLPRPSRPS
jgi:hypothetical protein